MIAQILYLLKMVLYTKKKRIYTLNFQIAKRF